MKLHDGAQYSRTNRRSPIPPLLFTPPFRTDSTVRCEPPQRSVHTRSHAAPGERCRPAALGCCPHLAPRSQGPPCRAQAPAQQAAHLLAALQPPPPASPLLASARCAPQPRATPLSLLPSHLPALAPYRATPCRTLRRRPRRAGLTAFTSWRTASGPCCSGAAVGSRVRRQHCRAVLEVWQRWPVRLQRNGGAHRRSPCHCLPCLFFF